MLILNLTRGKSGMCVPLRLPATPADIGEAYSKLDEISTKVEQTRIASVISKVGSLNRYYRDRIIGSSDNYTEFNKLAEKISRMNETKLKTFDGALNAESINGISDILHIADSLKDYIFISGVTTEKELGRFLVDSGYKDFPESAKPYLDYAAIGTEYYAERGGAFTSYGYTLRRSSTEPMISEQNAAVQGAMQTDGLEMKMQGY